MCGSIGPNGYYCTVKGTHDGDHVAGGGNGITYETWPNKYEYPCIRVGEDGRIVEFTASKKGSVMGLIPGSIDDTEKSTFIFCRVGYRSSIWDMEHFHEPSEDEIAIIEGIYGRPTNPIKKWDHKVREPKEVLTEMQQLERLEF